MHQSPLVTVITPSFNSSRFIEETILSVKNQTYSFIQHVIVDGGSTDDTIAILERYGNNLCWTSEPDTGQSDALNKGLQYAKGDIVGWLNSDDTYTPCALEEAVNMFLSRRDVGMVFGNCGIIDESGRQQKVLTPPEYDLARELTDHLLPQPSSFFRKSVLERVGFVDIGLHYAMDYDLFLRIGCHYPVARIPEVLANFRICEGTKTTTNPLKFWQERIQIFNRFFDTPNLPEKVVAARSKAYGRTHWMIALGLWHEGDTAGSCEHAEIADLEYGLIENDEEWAIEAMVEWAVGISKTNPINFARDMLRDTSLDCTRSGFAQRASVAVGLSAALMSHPGISTDEAPRLLLKAIVRKPKLILNRGIVKRLVSGLVRSQA